MSGWLNFNESLSSIKGQITTFASNVLAEDEGTDATAGTGKEDFKQACLHKDLEIQRLKKLNEDLQKSLGLSGQQNGKPNDNNWDWTTQELTVEGHHAAKEDVSHLKETVEALENEKKELLNQLEQLDLENQENLSQLVAIREKLQEENNELKDKNSRLKQQNKALITTEEKLKKQLTDSDKYETILKTNQDLNSKLEETTKELSVLKSTHDTLQKTLEDTQKSEGKELAELTAKLNKVEAENKIIHNEWQKAKEFVQSAELKSQEDAENCQKLAFILESYEKQVSLLKEELASIKNDNNTHYYSDIHFQSQLSQASETIKALQKENEQLKQLTSTREQEISSLQDQLQDYLNLKEDTTRLKDIVEEKQAEKESMHNMYVNIITDNIKRYIDSSALLPSEHHHQYEASEDPHVSEFSRQIENIFKILLEFKQKCESLEKDLIEASKEKTEILNEKYNEFEKLIQNSEVLSQEVIKKGETIKGLESEVSNLISSNDMILSELDAYKNAGLQTISESNEDNMVLLETDLENANKRIKELEEIIDSPSKTASTSNTISNDSLEGQINHQKHEDYRELLNSFDDLKIDYDDLTYKLQESNEKLIDIEAENEDLKTHLEKTKADFENIEYQLSESNFTADSLREELETAKLNTGALQQENKELKLQNMNSIDMKSDLNEIKEKWLTEENRRRELETHIKALTEKQQISKMTETSLKLQFDTLNKEYLASNEAKNNLEHSLGSAKKSIADYENNYTELLQKYDTVLLRCEELSTNIHEKEQELLLRTKHFEEQCQKLEKMLHQEGANSAEQEDAAKLNQLLQEKDSEIANVINNLKNVEQTTSQQKHEIEELISKRDSLQDSLSCLESQISIKDDELVQLRALLEATQQRNSVLEELTNHQPSESSISAYEEKEKLQSEITRLEANLNQSALLQQQLQELSASRNELINMVTIKHQESINYHNEIQRLSEILKSETQKCVAFEAKLIQTNEEIARKSEEIDRLTDENNFLKEKCDVLTKNLLEEQAKLAEKSGPSEKELSLAKQLERLQSHLVELEGHYTEELLQAEQKNAELQAKVTNLELREKNSSTMYTSVSIRANQQVETLQSQLQMVTNQREDLRKKISDAEDLNNKQAVALANLQFVLEQFQKDKEKDVQKETERIRRQINAEKQVQNELREEIDSLKAQLEESKVGLQAASRLSDQLELLKKQNSGLKEEVSQLQQKLSKSQRTIHELTSQTDGKIDKSLIKSLLVGFLSSGNTNSWNKDQTQVLKLIATVLDFNQQDHDKVKLNKPHQHHQGSWLGSILFPQPNNQTMSQESLSQAFVKFLENESKPRVVPSLLGEQSISRPSTSTGSSKRNTPTTSPSPIVLNEVVLPTFADFGQSRNSSSILKDVLKDNNG